MNALRRPIEKKKKLHDLKLMLMPTINVSPYSHVFCKTNSVL